MRSLQPPVPSRMTVGLSSYATVSSLSVPMPPEIMITASAARTVSVLRIHPMRRKRDVDVGVRVRFVEPGQDPDDEPVRGFRAAAHRLHHTREPATHHDRATFR